MCGILALIGTPWQNSHQAAFASIKSRGPDDSATWSGGEALLAHHRLAVIDLVSGRQPMGSKDGRHVIVFNGEIYNYRELRDELAAAGHAFATQSDTEVILHGFREWGEGVAGRLDGMFAFLIWDGHERTAFAARDRLGVKPLFYSTAHGLAVASTLKPFFHLEGFPRRIDYEALRDYLASQFVLAPHTMLRDVRQLPPASRMRYDARTGTLAVERYWRIPQPQQVAPDADETLERVDAALRRSVKHQVISDVPLGAFLSGGIDSSLMVHYMAEAGVSPLETFSVRFRQEGFDETAYAKEVADRYGARHHVIDAPDIGAETLAAAIRALDQPLADPAYVATAELSRLTRQHVAVAISGDGGDELFGGYARFREQESDYPASTWRSALRRLVDAGLLPGALLRRSLSGQERVFYRRVEVGPWEVSRKSLKRYLSPDAWQACHPERTMEAWRELALGEGSRMDSGSLMRADLWTYLSENCLVKTDRASMLHGLEVRVPFLGNEVLDAVLELPSGVHFEGSEGGGKALLRRLAQRYLPEAVWNRPKHGFSVPLQDYFNGQWQTVCEDHVARAAQLAPFLDPAAVSRLWRAARRGRASRRLAYTLIVLLMWLDGNSIAA
jgi:asparagine synthase (glutamine-hydrolysing)